MKIETNRLILRLHQKEDFNELHKMWSDENIVKYISGKPSSEAESWRRLMVYRGHWDINNYGYFAVILKETNEYIGDCGLSDFKRGLKEIPEAAPEIGWMIKSQAQGNGYASEAISAILNWFDNNFQDKTYCIIDPINKASIRIAEKSQYKFTQQATYAETLVNIYSREKQ